jgi:hypothetical protein
MFSCQNLQISKIFKLCPELQVTFYTKTRLFAENTGTVPVPVWATRSFAKRNVIKHIQAKFQISMENFQVPQEA